MAFNEQHHETITTAHVVKQAAEADLGATVGLAVNDASATLVATRAEHDATRTKINNLLTKLEAAGVLAP